MIRDRLERIPGWAWLLLAAALRLAFAVKLGEGFYQTDEAGYFFPALNLAQHGVIGTELEPHVLPPLPAAFFGFFLWLGGPRKLAARLGQTLLSAATCGLIGRMTERLTGSPRAGRLALALSAVYPFFIYYSGMIMSETLYLAAATAGLWLLCEALKADARDLHAAGAGLFLALATLARTEAAPIAVLLWLAVAVFARWPWRRWALALLCWSLPLGLWCARNRAVSGAFALDLHGGMTLLHGSVLFDYNEVDTTEAQKAVESMDFYRAAQNLPESERDRAYRRAAFAFMRDNPGKVLVQWAKKFVNFWRFYPRPEKKFVENAYSHPGAGLGRTALVLISLLFEPALILLGFAGQFALRGRARELFPLWLFIAATCAVHVVSVSQMRYRLAVMPILIMGACCVLAGAQSTKR